MPGLLQHHRECGARSVVLAVDEGCRCYIVVEVHLARPLRFFIHHEGLSACRNYVFILLSVIHFGVWLAMSGVVPVPARLHACANSKTNACSGKWKVLGLR